MLRLLQRFEASRSREYAAVVLSRPDIVIVSKAIEVPRALESGTVYVHNSDHHHDSTDESTDSDPMSRGLCGQMPNDWFAYGDRASMGAYLSAFLTLPELHVRMRATRGSCDWWRCHNYRYNHTFLNSAEAYLGFHLRASSLKCVDVSLQQSRSESHGHRRSAPIPNGARAEMRLPLTRKRDWGPHTLGMG